MYSLDQFVVNQQFQLYSTACVFSSGRARRGGTEQELLILLLSDCAKTRMVTGYVQ